MVILEIVLVIALMFVLLKVTPTEGGSFFGNVEIEDKRFTALSGFAALLGAFLLFSGIYILGSAMAMGGLCYTWAILQYSFNRELNGCAGVSRSNLHEQEA